MKYKCLVFVVMGLLMVSACAPDTEQTTTEADVAAINEIWVQYAGSFSSGDLDSWISLWAENGVQMAPDAPAVIGKEQIRAKYESILPQFTFKMAITTEEIRVAGEWAFSTGIYAVSITPKAGGETAEIAGKYLTILERQADGSWKIVRDCFNSNVPPPA